MSLVAGASSETITCDIGAHLAGQLYPRSSDRVLDDLEANAMYLADGTTGLLLMNCDLIGLPREYVTDVREKIAADTDVPLANIII